MEDLTRRELLIWLAGFFEGEGSMMIEPREARQLQGVQIYRRLRISVSQKYKEPLEYYVSLFGGSLTHSSNNGMWHWVIGDANGEKFLNEMVQSW